MHKPVKPLALYTWFSCSTHSIESTSSVAGKFLLSLTLVVVSSSCRTEQGVDGIPPKCAADVRFDATQASGVPILLTITLTNKGDKAMDYPRLLEYSVADWFKVRITDAEGKVREVPERNQPRAARSGGDPVLGPGKSVEILDVIPPLAVGNYKIQFGNGKSTEMVVKDEPELVRARENDLLTKIRKGDLLDYVVVAKFATKALVESLLMDLLSDDDRIPVLAAYVLYRVPKLPNRSVAQISKSMDRHLAVAIEMGHMKTTVLRDLADLASKVGSDEALEPVIKLARTERFRGGAIWALGQFKQKKASQALHRFLKDEIEELQFEAARQLSASKDPAAIPVLVKIAENPKSRWRMHAIDSLIQYPDDPNVELVVKTALDDPDSNVRLSAEFVFRHLNRLKEQKP